MSITEKVTKINTPYPLGHEPDFIVPSTYLPYRYIIGKKGENMLVALCMNPSKAQDITSDRTVNTVIRRAQREGYDGWAVINIYPERATDKKNLEKFDPKLCDANVEAIRRFIQEHNINEIWGAWGKADIAQLHIGRDAVLTMLKEEAVSVYGFNRLKSGEPHHPLYINYEKAIRFNYM